MWEAVLRLSTELRYEAMLRTSYRCAEAQDIKPDMDMCADATSEDTINGQCGDTIRTLTSPTRARHTSSVCHLHDRVLSFSAPLHPLHRRINQAVVCLLWPIAFPVSLWVYFI